MESNEEKKKYLKKYRRIVASIEKDERELEEMREMKYGMSINNNGMPHGSNSSDLSDLMARLDEIERNLQQKKNERIKLYIEISDQLIQLDNEDERNVLFYRYIKGMEWWQVAEKMGYSERHIYRLSKNALTNFKIPKDVSECQLGM